VKTIHYWLWYYVYGTSKLHFWNKNNFENVGFNQDRDRNIIFIMITILLARLKLIGPLQLRFILLVDDRIKAL